MGGLFFRIKSHITIQKKLMLNLDLLVGTIGTDIAHAVCVLKHTILKLIGVIYLLNTNDTYYRHS